MTNRLLALLLVSLASLVALTVGSCSPTPEVNFIPEGGSYAASDLAQALEDSDAGAAARVTAADAPDVRQDALANLRTNGEQAAELADTLTGEFPADVAAVPYQVELGMYEGEQAWLVYEAWGEGDAELSYRRIWVFSYQDMSMLAAHSIR